METYGFRKKKKLWRIPLIVVGSIFLIIYAVGIIVSVTNADRDKITKSVSENNVLKEQINTLNMQISDMQKQIDDLNAQIAAMPTPEPTPEASPEAVAEQEEQTSPRTEYDEYGDYNEYSEY